MQDLPRQQPQQNEQDLSLRSTVMINSPELIAQALASIKPAQNMELEAHALKVTQVTSGRDLTLHSAEDEMIEEDFTLWLDEDEPELESEEGTEDEHINPNLGASQSLQASENEKGVERAGEAIAVFPESSSESPDMIDISGEPSGETTEAEAQEFDKDDFSSIPDLSDRSEQVEEAVESASIIETPEPDKLDAAEDMQVFAEQSETATLTEAEAKTEMLSEPPTAPEMAVSEPAELLTWPEILQGLQQEQQKINLFKGLIMGISHDLSEIQSQMQRKDT